MSKKSNNTFEGTGVPIIKYPDNSTFKLPHPCGENRDGVEKYDFVEQVLDSYPSEGGQIIKVGKKFLFKANLSWTKANKVVLKALQKAASSEYITFTLNEDKSAIDFKVHVETVDFKFTKGVSGLGYDIKVSMSGAELLDAPGYGSLDLTGYGLDYGNKTDNQSP